MEIIMQLKKLGYTEYESKAYIALVQQQHATAYQVSKHSGVPRARIYDTLDSLAEKGLVMKEEVANQITYRPIPIDIFLQKTTDSWQQNISFLTIELTKLEQQQKQVEKKLLVLKNEEMIVSYCRKLLKKAKKRIVLSMWDSMYELLREDIEQAAQDVRIQGMTLHVKAPLETLDQHRLTYFTENKNSKQWFILSVDGEEMVYGASLDAEPSAFYTDDAAHIYLLEDYIWHDVLVNRLVQRNNDNLEDWVAAERAKFFSQKEEAGDRES